MFEVGYYDSTMSQCGSSWPFPYCNLGGLSYCSEPLLPRARRTSEVPLGMTLLLVTAECERGVSSRDFLNAHASYHSHKYSSTYAAMLLQPRYDQHHIFTEAGKSGHPRSSHALNAKLNRDTQPLKLATAIKLGASAPRATKYHEQAAAMRCSSCNCPLGSASIGRSFG